EKPAELRGAAFETGLVARILDDVGEEPGNLPLLEFALSLLWERMDQGWMTHAAYDAIGRVDGALARYAEEVFAALPAGQQAAAQRIFIQLVQPGEGTEDTRRVASRSELGDPNWPLVQHLADKRLIVTGQDDSSHETVEVVHEALIRSWQRLRGWIGADRAFRVWQEGLRAAMRQWQANNHDEGALLRGAPLITAETWLAERGAELSPAERNFIETSVTFRASEQARRERRRRLIVGGLAGGLAISLILLAVALWQSSRAGQSAATAEAESLSRATAQAIAEIEARTRATAQAAAEDEARSRATAQAQTELQRLRAEAEVQARATAQAEAETAKVDALTQASILASQSIQELQGGFPERAPLLALEALENYPYTAQAERALGQAVFFNHLRHVLSHEGGVNTAFWSPDGTRIVTATDKVARIWDARTGDELFTLHPEESRMWGAGWSPDGERVWVVEDLTTSVWEASTGKR
ncbi:MAG: hypothetical protein KDH89_21260, partial [Anaerolineae bacterium]|nr:hypothetical protein [Anaerolineae bacterium]